MQIFIVTRHKKIYRRKRSMHDFEFVFSEFYNTIEILNNIDFNSSTDTQQIFVVT